MAFLDESLRGRPAARLERPVGVRVSRSGRKPDGGVLPASLAPLRVLDTEMAYVVSLVLHTLWGGLGAFWRRRGWASRSRVGSGGVFVVELRLF